MIISIDRALVVSKNQTYDSNRVHKTNYIEFQIIVVGLILAFINSHYLFFLDLIEIREIFRKNEDEEGLSFYLEDLNETNLTINYVSYKVNYACFPNSETKYYHFIVDIWVWIDLCVYSLIPFVVMVICSIIIIVKIKSKSKGFIRNSGQENLDISEKVKRRNKKLLIMLILTNSYFILCTMPLCVDMILYKFQILFFENIYFQAFFHVLAYSNNSINFVFYILFSNKYRNVLVKKFF
jgi:hypothetical protein